MDEVRKAAVYTRVSTAEQVNGFSLDEQEKKCKAQIEAKGWELVGVYSDPGRSGRTLDRDGLQKMLADIKAGLIQTVVVYKLDRLSRTQKDTLRIIENELLAHDVDLVSLNETLDTTTPWGRAMIGILSAFNQMELETIQMRTTDGRRAKAQSGGYAGGKPPIGYKAQDGNLVIVPEEAEVVRLVFQLRKNGGTLLGITEELNRRGYRTKKGLEFKHSAIQNILANEDTYRGKYKYGDMPEMDGTHEPILTD